MSDPRFDLPDLNAAQLGELMGLTETQVKKRVTKKRFVCHWHGGTAEHPRGMYFTPEDVEYNRNTAGTFTAPNRPSGLSDAQIRKGIARLRKAQATTGLQRSNAA